MLPQAETTLLLYDGKSRLFPRIKVIICCVGFVRSFSHWNQARGIMAALRWIAFRFHAGSANM